MFGSTRAIPVDNVTYNAPSSLSAIPFAPRNAPVSPKASEYFFLGFLAKKRAGLRIGDVKRAVGRDSEIVKLHCFRRSEAIGETALLQIVAHDRVAPLFLRALLEAIRADGIQMSAHRIDRESENSIEFLRRAGEIARLAFRVGHNDLVFGNAADEKALACGVECDALRNELRIVQAKSYRSKGVADSSSASSLRIAWN